MPDSSDNLTWTITDRHFDGVLVLGPTDPPVTDIEAPNLEEIFGDVIIMHTRYLRRIYMPALKRVYGRVDIVGNAALDIASVSFISFKTISTNPVTMVEAELSFKADGQITIVGNGGNWPTEGE